MRTHFISYLRAYLQLTKPGIVLGNALTACAGFFLASEQGIQIRLLAMMLLGLCSVIAAGCVANNYMDRKHDQKMERTKERVLVKGEVSPQAALYFAWVLGLVGILILSIETTVAATAVALIGLFVYLGLYSTLKYKTTLATLIGSVAGATPPVVGYLAVIPVPDVGALLLFLLLVFWQMPHFFAIAIYREHDYRKASIPVLPIVKGMKVAQVQMLIYLILFLITVYTVALFFQLGMLYWIAMAFVGGAWLTLSLKGFNTQAPRVWGRKMFVMSLVAITCLSTLIPFCKGGI